MNRINKRILMLVSICTLWAPIMCIYLILYEDTEIETAIISVLIPLSFGYVLLALFYYYNNKDIKTKEREPIQGD